MCGSLMAPLALLFEYHMSMYTNWATAFWETMSWLAIDFVRFTSVYYYVVQTKC
jgi:hypothetical protein